MREIKTKLEWLCESSQGNLSVFFLMIVYLCGNGSKQDYFFDISKTRNAVSEYSILRV